MREDNGQFHPLYEEWVQLETRRQFFARGKNVLGLAALAELGVATASASIAPPKAIGVPGALPKLHFAPKAKRVIYLHMVGGPPQMDLFDYKPKMNDWYDKDLPESVRNATMRFIKKYILILIYKLFF